MADIQRHFISNGNYFVSSFASVEAAAEYEPEEGVTDVPARPTPNHVWQGSWVYQAPAPVVVTSPMIAVEVERRIALPLGLVGLSVGELLINMDAASQRNIQGLASMGLYLSTADPTRIVEFRDNANTAHDLLPSDLVSLGLQVAARIQAVYTASWALKEMSPIPVNYADDGYWPEANGG